MARFDCAEIEREARHHVREIRPMFRRAHGAGTRVTFTGWAILTNPASPGITLEVRYRVTCKDGQGWFRTINVAL